MMRSVVRKSHTMDRIVTKLVSGSMVFASIAVIILFVLVMAEIIARKFFSSTTYISGEFSEYCLMVIIMFGLGDLFKRRGHLSVTIIVERLSVKLRSVVDLICSMSFFLVYCVTLTFICFRLAKEAYEFGVFTASLSHTPLWIPMSLMVVGLVVIDLALISEIIKWFRSSAETQK
jgi:TRAP-type C4-dicarboxylate transport system permease small subunit